MGVLLISNVYNRLLRLYRKNRDSGKTPLEDYTTEILVGLLQENNNILDDFTENILDIEGECFKVDSQKRYYLKNDTECIVDIVFESKDSVCFLENKVNSKEGDRQLERYSKVLWNIQKECGKKVYLRYCTKYYEVKSVEDMNFKQFRWMNVDKFLKKYENDKMVKDFLDFLRSEGMVSSGEFNFQDMIVLSNINNTFSKINECFDNVEGKFKDVFGEATRTTTVKQIKEYNGYWLWRKDVLGDGYSEVYIGICVSNSEDKTTPRLQVGIKCGKNNSMNSDFNKKSHDNEGFFDFIDIDDDESCVWFEEGLSRFIDSEGQLEEIENWFTKRIDDLNEFRKNTYELNWKI